MYNYIYLHNNIQKNVKYLKYLIKMSNKITDLFNNLTIETEEDTIESHNPNKAWAKMNCVKKSR